MRYSRQNKMLELIKLHEIETQEKLCTLLRESGYNVTQATVSRDIKDLQLVKKLSDSGRYKYSQTTDAGPISERFIKIFRETILSVSSAENIIVIKTLSGCGPAAGEALDSLAYPHVIGSVAGDNTIMIVIDDKENVAGLVQEFQELL